jgi:hypothetical protein
MKISRHVVEIKSVVEFMFSLFNDWRQSFVSLFDSFDLIQCLNIISIESNDVQYDVDFDAIRFEIMIDSNVVNIAEVSQIFSDFEI